MKIISVHFILSGLLCSFINLSPKALAKNEDQDQKSKIKVENSSPGKTFTIGVEKLEYYPNYTYKGNEYGGFARAFLDSFAASKGYTFKYEIVPIKRLFEDYLHTDSKLDFKYPDNSYWQADLKAKKNVIYSEPIVEYIDGVMVKKSNLGKGLTHLKKLGTARGFTPWTYMDAINEKKVQVMENDSFSGLLHQTIGGRIDGAYISIAVAMYNLNKVLNRPDELVFDQDLPHTRSFYHVSSLKFPEIIKELNEYLKTSKKEISAMKKEYGVDINEYVSSKKGP
ncbi:MAG: transporter substrate-binding domain-containing protein [Pseudobdellovibrionaceae bacterium]|nr:transporter substrate-binding domain-containing protein [Pseudobdellovibrionaceae bacterium]